MILLTRLSGSPFVLNSDLIERIDSTPDTIVTLVDGSKYVVSESMRAIVAAVRQHRAEVIALSEIAHVAADAAAAEAHAHQQPPGLDRGSPWTALTVPNEPARPTLSVVNGASAGRDRDQGRSEEER